MQPAALADKRLTASSEIPHTRAMCRGVVRVVEHVGSDTLNAVQIDDNLARHSHKCYPVEEPCSQRPWLISG